MLIRCIICLLVHIYIDTLSTLCFVFICKSKHNFHCIMHQISKHAICCIVLLQLNHGISHITNKTFIYPIQNTHLVMKSQFPYRNYIVLHVILNQGENQQKHCNKITNFYYCHNLIYQKSCLECWPLCCKISHESNKLSMSTASCRICTILNLGRKLSEKRP